MDFFKKIPVHMVKKLKSIMQYLKIRFQDFEGQARAEKLSRIIITLFGAVGLIWGYIIQQFSQTVYILGAGFLLASLVRCFIKQSFSNTLTLLIFYQLTIPPWPMYRRKPLNWQPSRENDGHSKEGTKKGKKNK